MAEIVRKAPADARRVVTSGKALLVCGYESEATYATMPLEKSLSWGQFLKQLPKLDKGQEIIFYCA